MALMRSRVAANPRNPRIVRRGSLKNRPRRRRLAPALQQLEPRHLLAFSANVFADINLFGVSSIPDSFVELGNEVFFVANDGRTGSELWKSDGTEEGTVLVADINPGPNGSLPSDLVVFGNDLFFTALDQDDEFDIWKSDGTTSGTVKVFDADSQGVYEITQLTPSGERIFFTAFEFDSGYELWATDGTSSGTALVKDINLDQAISEPPRELTDVDGTLFFTSYSNGYDNRELWKSNGTAIGTVLVANVDGEPLESSSPRNLTNVGGTLYFAADDPDTGVELYKSGGTEATTVLVEDLNVGSGSSYPESLTEFQGQLFFTANDGTGRQLFRTDGNSITFVANTTTGQSGSSAPTDLTVVGDELFFVSNGGAVPGPVTASQPNFSAANSFRSGGGNFAGLVAVKTSPYQGIVTTAQVSNSFALVQQTGTSSDGPGWVAEGARIGDVGVGLSTIEVGDFILRDVDVPGDVSDPTWEWTIEDPAGLSSIEFAGFVSGNEYDEPAEALLFELFLNGSATRTSFLQVSGDDLDNWFADRDANNLSLAHPGGESITSATVRMSLRVDGGPVTSVNDSNEALVLNASLTALGQSSGVAGRELHKFDGTTTTLVKDIVTAGSSDPVELTESGGKLFFTANDPLSSGRELWVSDGTTEGTMLVEDIRSGFDLYGAPLDGNPRDLTNINGTLFFSVVDENNDREVWTSDGTPGGTDLLKNIHIGTQDANVQQPVQVGSKLFFVADDGINGEAVWVVDLNSADPPKIAADVTASSSDRINGLAKFGNGVIFHNDSLGIYTADGVSAPVALLDATPIEFNDQGDLFLEVGSLAYFVRSTAANGEELWKTNGTPGGTSLVADIFSGQTGSQPRYLVEFLGQLYFSADYKGIADDATGRELLRSDGTAAGTVLVADINFDPPANDPESPITQSSDPQELTVSGSRLFFSADGGVANGDDGRELWATDGTSVSLVSDIRSGSNDSSPTNLTDVNGVLYFSANNGSSGFEPFRSEGTSATTSLVANINAGNASSNPSGFMQAGSVVYFSAFDSDTGVELYVTNGTSAGTSLVRDLQTGISPSDPVPLGVVSGDRILVAATGNGTQDRELWMAGGEISGLAQVLDMNPGEFFGSFPTDLIPNGSSYLFVGNDGLSGRELYELEEFDAEVEEVIIDDGSGQRSTISQVQVIFNTVVDLSGDAFDFVNSTTGASVVDVPVVTENQGKTVVTFSFNEGASVNNARLLRDGRYVLTVLASQVTSLGIALDGDGDGNVGDNYVLGADEADGFYRKYGDGNGNGTVDLTDFGDFRRTFGESPGSDAWNRIYDDEGDGTIGVEDFAEFRRNFGT